MQEMPSFCNLSWPKNLCPERDQKKEGLEEKSEGKWSGSMREQRMCPYCQFQGRGKLDGRTQAFPNSLSIVLVVLIQPGKWMTTNIEEIVGEVNKAPCISTAVDTILDLVRSLFPENLMEATFRSHKVCMKFLNGSQQMNPDVVLKMSTEERAAFTELPERVTSDGMNILGLVMFSVALGITIGWIGEEGNALKAFFKSLETVSMKLISLVIWYSPLGITFLIASQIVGMKDPGKELQRLMGYMITVLIGLFIHGFVMLPILMITLARRNPIKYVYGMAQALLTALATSSSSATLPLSIKCVEENNGVDSRVARFVLPLGATINMDGTALYEAVAAIYISQCVGLDLSLGQIILVSLTATLASIGAAGIPQAGIVTMIMVLIAIGLPSNLFILIFPVDFFLDRIRTTVNVHGDSIGAAVVGKLCEKYLKQDRTAGAASEHNEQGYSMLSTTASPDPSKRISIGNHHYENSHML
ncbi:excitatory amino acid transporter 1 family protein [Teladorsagia circumcincta]|uniref:Amino acid transporter n=1 Tax=Teladorsagia circumcincta TaxID=45464 RepID=A0A2G9V2K3_TELCI|nr:excitatory amino acid transporter 1 family protein [Teladorsagia circumcincta]